MNVAEYTKTLDYLEENLKKLHKKGYIKSSVSKPYSKGKVIRYNYHKKVYWFSDRTAAHMSDCYFTQKNTRTLIII